MTLWGDSTSKWQKKVIELLEQIVSLDQQILSVDEDILAALTALQPPKPGKAVALKFTLGSPTKQ